MEPSAQQEHERLSGDELVALVRRVFAPRPEDTGIGLLVDLPDDEIPDNPAWKARRQIAGEWARELQARRPELGLETDLFLYRNVHSNNGDLPAGAWRDPETGGPPARAEDLDAARQISFAEIFARHSILIAPTEFSATAPLKIAARSFPIRAATMPGFSLEMIPALRLDYAEVNRRVARLKELLDRATGAEILFRHPGGEAELTLDLRFRPAHASGGLIRDPGTAGNLPSGEAYIVPYEGEREGIPSTSGGLLPVQFRDEVVVYRIVGNRAVSVEPGGPAAATEAARLDGEPAYGNLAELGLGVLAAFGIRPIGTVLLDEKLGLHIAFGRSDHFGGHVGAAQFSSPEAVVHVDRVYVAETQPLIQVPRVDLLFPDGERLALMRDGDYAPGLFASAV